MTLVDETPRLIQDLGSRRDAANRRAARERLTSLGPKVLPELLACLRSRDAGVRWEAAKILQSVRDPAAAPLLCEALQDRDPGVQWVAAGALIALGAPAVAPLLDALIRHPRSIPVRHGAHHVLLSLSRAGTLSPPARPLLAALEGDYGDLAIIPAAERALQALAKASARP